MAAGTDTDYDQQRLLDALERTLQLHGWSIPSVLAANGVHERYRRVNLVLSGRWLAEAEPFRFVLDDFSPVRQAWISALEPGGFIRPHRDAAPWFRRWHIPIVAAGTITTDGEEYTPRDGVPFPVEHWRCHSLRNPTDRMRVHLVLDTDELVDRPAETFALCPEEGTDG